MADARDIFAYASDPQVARFVLWEPHQSLSDTRGYIRYVRGLYFRGLPSSWAVTLRESGRVIGTVGFMFYSEANNSAEIGYSYARGEWNKAQHDIRNPASGRVMEKCGMRREGILRQRILNKGEYADVALYSLLRSDLEC